MSITNANKPLEAVSTVAVVMASISFAHSDTKHVINYSALFLLMEVVRDCVGFTVVFGGTKGLSPAFS